MTTDASFYFERFYMSLIFSIISFLIWFILKKKINKPIRDVKYTKLNDSLSWYFKYKFYLVLKYLLFFFIGTLVISIVSLIQFFCISNG